MSYINSNTSSSRIPTAPDFGFALKVEDEWIEEEKADERYLHQDGSSSLTGNLNMDEHKIINLGSPTEATDVVTVSYVSDNYVHQDGSSSLTGNLNMDGNKIVNSSEPTESSDLATKQYVDTTTVPVTIFNDNRLVEEYEVNGNSTNQITLTITLPKNTEWLFHTYNCIWRHSTSGDPRVMITVDDFSYRSDLLTSVNPSLIKIGNESPVVYSWSSIPSGSPQDSVNIRMDLENDGSSTASVNWRCVLIAYEVKRL